MDNQKHRFHLSFLLNTCCHNLEKRPHDLHEYPTKLLIKKVIAIGRCGVKSWS